MIFFQVFQQRRQFFQLRALPRIYQQGRARKVSFTRGVQLRKDGDELHRKIVHAVETHVFEGVQDGAFSGAGESGEDDEMPRVVSAASQATPLSSFPGAGGCWEFSCLRGTWQPYGG